MEAYLDIETTGLSPYYNQITVVGISIGDSSNREVLQLIAPNITANNLREVLKGVKTIYTYNGRFDLPFLRSHLGIDLGREFRHHDLMLDCWRKNLYGGLKVVERRLGMRRKLKDVDGREAIRLWMRYEKQHDYNALSTLLEYNKEDVLNLKTLKEMLRD